MAKHARLSPSASGTWMKCPGSIPFAEKHGLKGKETIYAAVGTATHEVSEKCLRTGAEPDDFIGEKVYGIKFTPEMADNARVYVEYVRSIKAEIKLYEQRFKVSGVENCEGTADTLYVKTKLRKLGTVDLKTGSGVRVDALKNSQQLIYVLGAYDSYSKVYDFDSVEVTIVQPPLRHIDTYEVDVKDLLKFRGEIQAAAQMIAKAEKIIARGDGVDYPDWVFVPGEKQCRFCNSKPRCPGLAKMSQRAAVEDFAKTKDEDTEFLIDWYKKAPLIEGFLKAVKEEISSRLHGGKKVPGYRLGVGKTVREFKNPALAEKRFRLLFGDTVYEPGKFKSIPQLEKMDELKSIEFDLGPYIEKKEYPTIVAEDSNKPVWDANQAARQDFSKEE